MTHSDLFSFMHELAHSATATLPTIEVYLHSLWDIVVRSERPGEEAHGRADGEVRDIRQTLAGWAASHARASLYSKEQL
jgi:hypothetical protein